MTTSTKPFASLTTPADDNFDIAEVHAQIGRRIQQARIQAKLSRALLGNRLGVSATRIADYERGARRLPVSTLFELGAALSKPVLYFFNEAPRSPAQGSVESGLVRDRSRETFDLIQAFDSIPNASSRRDVIRLLQAIRQGFKLH